MRMLGAETVWSPLSRGRGMKQARPRGRGLRRGVAPLAGAWIETSVITNQPGRYNVAPLAGAWIETFVSGMFVLSMPVAPLAGAWIETVNTMAGANLVRCRPSRGGVD